MKWVELFHPDLGRTVRVAESAVPHLQARGWQVEDDAPDTPEPEPAIEPDSEGE